MLLWEVKGVGLKRSLGSVQVWVTICCSGPPWNRPVRETLENQAHPRENTRVSAGADWAHGRQAAWIR